MISPGTSQAPAGSTRMAPTVGTTHTLRPVPHINLLSNGKWDCKGMHHSLIQQFSFLANRPAPGKPVLLKISNEDGAMMTIGQNGSQTPTRADRGRKITSGQCS